jgi:hypothetical protein
MTVTAAAARTIFPLERMVLALRCMIILLCCSGAWIARVRITREHDNMDLYTISNYSR